MRQSRRELPPVYGMDARVAEGTFSLFVKSEAGYRNLCALTYLASLNKLTLNDIYAHKEGSFASIPSRIPFFTPVSKASIRTTSFI
jgi:DNA polymerase III alpha subunit